MLGDTDAVATIAVKDLEAAKTFYESVLRLTPMPSRERGVLEYKSGNGRVLVYQSQFAGTNKATAATWPVANVEREVADLKSRGVTFEHYDFPGMKRQGDVHEGGSSKAAWFKDPDGNIHAVVSR
jgi:catechol-2,3-dioxygenase